MKKNIIWICSDQQRADSLGCMGNTFAETPHLDALASKGALLQRLISAHPVCMPSRASMLTGSHPTRHGVISNGIPLAERAEYDHEKKSHVQTMAHHLRDQDYHTRCIGKLHLQPHQAAVEHGFRESYAMWDSGENELWTGPLYGFEHLELSERHGAQPGGSYLRWLKKYNPEQVALLLDTSCWPEPPCSLGDLQASPISADCTATMWVAHRFNAFLAERTQKKDEQPFFCWLGIPDPHHPWQPPQEVVERFSLRDYMQPVQGEKENPPTWWNSVSGGNNDLSSFIDTEKCIAMARRFTDAQNAVIDMAVGKILDGLKQAGLENDTVICFTSDHGDYLGDFNRIRKNGYSCQSLNRVPGIFYDPNGSLQGNIPSVCGHVDLAPSLCQAAGVPWTCSDGVALQNGFPGRAMVPCIQDNDAGAGTNIAWWTDTERYTYYPASDESEYYQHQDDPGEKNNIAKDNVERCHALKEKITRDLLCASRHDVARYSGW